MQVFQWTPDRVEILIRLWKEGLSGKEIAAKLGAGVTKNAVAGKVHRLGIKRAGSDVEPVTKKESEYLEPPPVLDPNVKPWMCRHPIDEPGRFGFYICGKTAQPGRYLCDDHIRKKCPRNKRFAEKWKEEGFYDDAVR